MLGIGLAGARRLYLADCSPRRAVRRVVVRRGRGRLGGVGVGGRSGLLPSSGGRLRRVGGSWEEVCGDGKVLTFVH